MRAKKSYGQHFLNNESIAERIADALELSDAYDEVLEIGPGQGMLTKYLLEKPYQLKVVEADKDMVAYLKTHYPQLSDRIIAANFLSINLNDYFKHQFAVIGNYPYNISSQILFRMIDYRTQIPEMVGMFQKEVAERVVAGPGSKTYGVIGILVQVYFEPSYLFTVKNSHFNPPPKVQSAVIRLVRRSQPLIEDELWSTFKQIVKITFGQRRKMLRNTLKAFLDKEDLQNPRFQARPEQLSVAEFVELARKIGPA